MGHAGEALLNVTAFSEYAYFLIWNIVISTARYKVNHRRSTGPTVWGWGKRIKIYVYPYIICQEDNTPHCRIIT